jgi:hypothetical protein
VQARTAGELRAVDEVVLPPVQMELFAEAGAAVAERAVAAGVGREVVAGILRRAADQDQATLARAIEQEPGRPPSHGL